MDTKNITEFTSESLSVNKQTVSICSAPNEDCKYCGKRDCDVNDSREFIEKYVQAHIKELQKHPRNIFRKNLYKVYITETYGVLGRGRRMQILECVILGIREYAPEIREEYYMGHKEGN